MAKKVICSTECQNKARVGRNEYRKVLGTEYIRELILEMGNFARPKERALLPAIRSPDPMPRLDAALPVLHPILTELS